MILFILSLSSMILFLGFCKKVAYQLDSNSPYKFMNIPIFNRCKTLNTHPIILFLKKVSSSLPKISPSCSLHYFVRLPMVKFRIRLCHLLKN